MTDELSVVSALEAAIGLPDTSLIVRSDSVIAEIRGPLPLRRGAAWLTLGQEAGTHVHLRASDLCNCRFSDPPDANAALLVLAADGALICKVSFRGTNPARAERFDARRAAALAARFAHLPREPEAPALNAER